MASTEMASTKPASEEQATVPLSTGLKAGWGTGSVGTQVVLFSQSALLLYFFSAVLGLEPAVAGGLLFAAKLFDAALAPAVGGWSDRTVTRFGRRRPFLLAGALLSAAGLAVVFNPPVVSLPVLFAALVLISLGYSAFNIPYLAMTAEMTDSPLERTALMSWRIAFVGIGTIIATSLLPLIARAGGGGAEGYGRAGLVAAVLVLLAMGIAFFATRGARATQARGGERHSLAEMLRAVASNRAFAWLLFAKLLQLVGLAASAASMMYFFKAVIGGDERMLAITGAVSNGVSILSLAFWPALGRRYGKVPLYALSVVGFALVGFSWLLAGSRHHAGRRGRARRGLRRVRRRLAADGPVVDPRCDRARSRAHRAAARRRVRRCVQLRREKLVGARADDRRWTVPGARLQPARARPTARPHGSLYRSGRDPADRLPAERVAGAAHRPQPAGGSGGTGCRRRACRGTGAGRRRLRAAHRLTPGPPATGRTSGEWPPDRPRDLRRVSRAS
jgi:MFS family permease